MFLEESQKEAIIAAYQKLHDQGVSHGDAEYRHWLIGDDGKLVIYRYIPSTYSEESFSRL